MNHHQPPTPRLRAPRFAALAFLFLAAFAHPLDSSAAAPLPSPQSPWSAAFNALPPFTGEPTTPVKTDWLVTPVTRQAGIYRAPSSPDLIMDNGLVRRTLRLSPNAATIGLDNLMLGEAWLRAVNPELRIRLAGHDYAVGGLRGQKEFAYLKPEWIDTMTSDPQAFRFTGFETGKIRERFPWKQVRHSAGLPWPPPGVELTLNFAPPVTAGAPAGAFPGLTLAVHYELYDGLPLMGKWFTLRNNGPTTLTLETFTAEILSLPEAEAKSDTRPGTWELPKIHFESDYAFRAMSQKDSDRTFRWVADKRYTTQANYELETPCTLESAPPIGPDLAIAPGASFESYRVWELLSDSTDRERRTLAQRRMNRAIAPWVTENPIMMHLLSNNRDVIKNALDQCADVGFEMAVLSFGSGINIENMRPQNLANLKELADYAHAKGVEIGGYTLWGSRSVNPATDVIDAKTGKPGGGTFGSAPCFGSPWGQTEVANLEKMFSQTGLSLLEHDGSYPGDLCASTLHPGHKGLNDSQWTQWRAVTAEYQWCRAHGVYLNVPDWYFLAGSTKAPMGYREVNFSLPRERQLLLCRQNIFDGTWEKTPSMGWMFVPLVQYHGGGAAATLEPLSQHLAAYDAQLAQNFGCGVQACYRGPRLYDTPETRAVVKKWVDFFKKYRPILESDIIHVRRPDGRNIDCMLHVNPQLPQKGLAMVFNPLDTPVKQTLRLPLYYTGLTGSARIREREAAPQTYTLDRRGDVEIPVDLPANSYTWFVIE